MSGNNNYIMMDFSLSYPSFCNYRVDTTGCYVNPFMTATSTDTTSSTAGGISTNTPSYCINPFTFTTNTGTKPIASNSAGKDTTSIYSPYAYNFALPCYNSFTNLTFIPTPMFDYTELLAPIQPQQSSCSVSQTGASASVTSSGLKSSNSGSEIKNGRIDNSYAFLPQPEAYKKAKTDRRLEDLSLCEKKGWSLGDTFDTDIKYGTKGSGNAFNLLSKELGCSFIVTSALGTKGNGKHSSPHSGITSYSSHFNCLNNKFDIVVVGMSRKEALKKLQDSPLILSAIDEGDHFDIQFNPEVYKENNSLNITV